MCAIAGAFPLVSGTRQWYPGKAGEQPSGCRVVMAQHLGRQPGAGPVRLRATALLLPYLSAEDKLGWWLTTREPGDPVFARQRWRGRPYWEVQGRKPMMHEHGKSDRRVVPTKPPNKGAGEPLQGSACPTPAEAVEGRRLATIAAGIITEGRRLGGRLRKPATATPAAQPQ